MLNTNAIVLKNMSPSNELLQATFLPDQGMNMISFKKGELEVIDQSTIPLFEERFAGLGALIGPHFHRRHPAILPKIQDESLFPHIARVKAQGVADPFSHGIARYAPWKATFTDSSVQATLSGKDLWNGVALADLEGQNFKMNFKANLTSVALEIDFDVVSDTDSLVGIHYYYHLPNGTGTVTSAIQSNYIGPNGKEALPDFIPLNNQNMMNFDLGKEADFTFYPFPNPREAKIILDTGLYQLETIYSCASQENCWQLYHPNGASFVCVEPISAQDPRHPNLTASSLKIVISIL
ncbi:MAG: hypothetical protein H0X29_08910 [Parachlamydiaceae bacterium]|nr:hypothetical protein [Parachlamydiaceae bacterium]